MNTILRDQCLAYLAVSNPDAYQTEELLEDLAANSYAIELLDVDGEAFSYLIRSKVTQTTYATRNQYGDRSTAVEKAIRRAVELIQATS